jgi:hypothetical protein
MLEDLLEISWLSYRMSRGSFKRWNQASGQSYFFGSEDFSTPDSSSTLADTSLFTKEEVDTLRQLMSRLETFASVFSKEEVDTLHRLMFRLETFATASSFAHTCNLATTFNASTTLSDDP